jgi:hypothetical protein
MSGHHAQLVNAYAQIAATIPTGIAILFWFENVDSIKSRRRVSAGQPLFQRDG